MAGKENEMKRRRNFLLISIGDGHDRALNINNITVVKKNENGTRIITACDNSYNVEESYEEVLNMIIGKEEK